MAKAKPYQNQEAILLCSKAAKAAQKAEKTIADNDSAKEQAFKNKFTVFEVCYKTLLADYLEKNNRPNSDSNLKFNITQARSVLNKLNIVMEEKDLVNDFSGTTNPGNRASRGLRNALVHNPKEKDYEELNSKYDELMHSMDSFLSAVTARSKGDKNE